MIEIDITTQCALWPDMSAPIEKAAALALKDIKHGGELSIVLADDKFIQVLNKNYRDKDKPTNVLSFPQDEDGLLGDIILAYETVKQEAETQGKDFEHHVIHLIVHGALHLVGLDHETDAEAEEMENLEIEILSELGIKNPYEISDSVTY